MKFGQDAFSGLAVGGTAAFGFAFVPHLLTFGRANSIQFFARRSRKDTRNGHTSLTRGTNIRDTHPCKKCKGGAASVYDDWRVGQPAPLHSSRHEVIPWENSNRFLAPRCAVVGKQIRCLASWSASRSCRLHCFSLNHQQRRRQRLRNILPCPAKRRPTSNLRPRASTT